VVVHRTKLLQANGTFDGTEQDNVAEITVDRDADLLGLFLNADYNATSTGDQMIIEISTNPNYQADSNGTVGQLAVMGNRKVITTSGAHTTALNMAVVLPKPVRMLAGEKIYLNLKGTNTVGYNVRCLCYFGETGSKTSGSLVK